MSAPDRIWAKDTDAVNGRNFVDTRTADIKIASYSIEYVLASTIPAMIAEAVARERESIAQMIDPPEEWREYKGNPLILAVSMRQLASAIRARKGDANE